MWDKRENNMMYQDQNMKFDSVGSEIPFMPSMRFPPPYNSSDGHFVVEASRKRKSLDMDSVHGGESAGFLGNAVGNTGHSLQREYTLQHNVMLPPPVDSRMLLNHNIEHANPRNAESQYGAFQYYNTDNSLLTTEAKDVNVKMASFGSVRPFNRNELSFPVQSLKEIPEHHDSKHLVCDLANRYEPIKFPSHYRQHSSVIEMSQTQAAFRLDGGKTLGLGNNSVPCDPYLYRYSVPSNNTSNLGSFNFRVFNENIHTDVGSFDQQFNRNGLLVEKEHGQVTMIEGDSIPIVRTNSTHASGFSEGRETYDFSQHCNNEIKSGSSIKNDNLGDQLNLREPSGPPTSRMLAQTESSSKEGCLDQVSKGFETKLLGWTEGSNTENTGHPLAEVTSLGSGNGVAKRPVEPEDGQPMNMEECSQLAAGKVSPLIAEKLWDGSLQLSTSTRVSALAFFKSGEKAPDMKWSEHIEIKGKVRLQAFEKFIQELPRSRNRKLMVISLCWKPGSSEAGLAGMKEVAKGYNETRRVGFAHISPGFDIYVCPRSEAIITILAKYGFFKGMAAVEDDQDSLIGCVIWRRGQNTSNPVPKISEKKKATNSPDSSVQEINSPITQVDDSESKQEKTSLTPSPLISKSLENKVIQVQPPATQKLDSTSLHESMKHTEIPVTKVVEPRQQTNTEFIKGSHNFTNFNSGPPGFTTSVSLDSLFTRPQLPTSQNLDLSYRLNPVQSNSKPEVARPALPGPPPLSLDFLHRISQFNRDAQKVPTEGIPKADTSIMLSEEPKKSSMGSKADDDDDDADLPEFDFDSAYGVLKAPAIRFPGSSHQTGVKPPPFNQVTLDGVKNQNWPMPSPISKPMDIRPTSNTLGIPCRTSAYEGSSKFEELNSKKSDKGTLSSRSFPKKSRWDNDDDNDDMPEWYPPNLENRDVPKSSIGTPMHANAKELPLTPSSMTALRPPSPQTALRPPPPKSQSFPHGYNPGIIQNRPGFGFVPIDFRPPQVSHPNNFMRPPVTNFNTNPPSSDFSWQWKRQ